ncbi:MAG: SDR family NAD(P)-dependent oxidoreductase [Acidimicrobiales bacterium]
MTFDFSDKTVLITGASYGLGEVFAQQFAEAGAELVLTARSSEQLEAVAEACRAKGSPKVTAVTGDVSVESDVKRVLAKGVEEHRRIDVLVNNAGVSDIRGFTAENAQTDTFDHTLAVDLRGAWLYLRECGRHMIESGGGSIVNIASILGDGGLELSEISYIAAKGALVNLTKQLGCEWADRGVRVNSVSPGFIITEMTRPGIEGSPTEGYIQSRTPMRRLGEADEAGHAVLFLASDQASYITGVNLNVDGGMGAGRGWWQIKPIHYAWNADTEPQRGEVYPGLVPQPDEYEPFLAGIPGVHYPVPEAEQG